MTTRKGAARSALDLLERYGLRPGDVVVDVAFGMAPVAERMRELGFGFLGVGDDPAVSADLARRGFATRLADPSDPETLLQEIESGLEGRPPGALCLVGTLSEVRSPGALLSRLRRWAETRRALPVVFTVANATHVDVVGSLLTNRWEPAGDPPADEGRATVLYAAAPFERLLATTGWEQADENDLVLEHPDPGLSVDDPALDPATPLGGHLARVRDSAGPGGRVVEFVRLCRPGAATPADRGPAPDALFLSVLLRTQGRRLATLQEALLSLAAQTSDDFEVILVAHDADPSARKDVETLVAEFHPRFAERVRLIEVKGGQRARPLNEGARFASGRYLATLDEDDLVFAHWVRDLEELAAAAPGHVVRTVVAVQQVVARPGAWDGDDGYDAVSAPALDYPPAFDHVEHLYENRTPNCAYAVPRSLVTRLGQTWDESLVVLEDWDHLLRVASLAGVVSRPVVTGLIRSWRNAETSKMLHGPEAWEESRRRVVEKQDSHPLLLDRGAVSRLRQLVHSEETARQEAARLATQLSATQDSLAGTKKALEHILNVLVDTERRLDEVLGSTSWRITAGVRKLSGGLRRVTSPGGGVTEAGSGRLPDEPPRQAPLTTGRSDYERWARLFDTLDTVVKKQIAQRLEPLSEHPLISVLVPVYNTPPAFLRAAVESVRDQVYENWELCIADDHSTDPAVGTLLTELAASDHRIKVVARPENGHIAAATNSALEVAQGEWVAFLDHDDVLPAHALALVVLALSQRPEAALVYSDEDKVDVEGRRFDPYFKPDFDPLLLLGQNYLAHFLVVRRRLVQRLGGLRQGFEGAQDWDFALRVTELIEPDQVVHIPHVLYHWRAHGQSTAEALDAKPYAVDAGRRTVTEHLLRTGGPAEVTTIPVTGHNRIRWPVPHPAPLVTMVVPTRDGRYLESCIESVLRHTTYPAFEVLIVDNGSEDPAILDYMTRHPDPRVRVMRDARPFNYSALNNAAVHEARGELVLLLNDDTEVASASWLDDMVSQVSRPGVGVVGAKLYYDNGTIQHAGVLLGIGGVAGHAYRFWAHDSSGYMGRLLLAQTMSAVTGACMLVRREVWQAVGGLEEEHLAVAFNDIDFCLRVRQAGWRVVWTPLAELVHHESVTRGPETLRIKEFVAETRFMQKRWGVDLERDPAYNPNLTLVYEDWSLAWPPRVAYGGEPAP